jgi:hypothetical protein
LLKRELFSRPSDPAYDQRGFSAAIQKFFQEYSEESLSNFHVSRFDPDRRKFSMCRTLVSDLLSIQAMYFRENRLGGSDGTPRFLFIPIAVVIADRETKQMRSFVLRHYPSAAGPGGTEWRERSDSDLPDVLERISEALFKSNFEIEYRLFDPRDNWFERLYTNWDSSSVFSGALEDNLTGFKEYVRDIAEVDKAFDEDCFFHFVDYSSQDAKEENSRLRVGSYYFKHRKLDAPIPNELIDFLVRIAIFTKRNRLNELKLEEQAVRAAVSQVMARNMSHNLGSHVMNRLTHAESLAELDPLNFDIYSPPDDLKLVPEALDSQGIYQQAHFNQYIKCRMDYLSDVTFGAPAVVTNKMVFSELYRDLVKVRILLEYISGLDDTFGYEIRFTRNGNPVSEENDFLVGIPNDLLGSHAFYNILENLIRNTAKHNQGKSVSRGTTFTVNFEDANRYQSPELDPAVSQELAASFEVEIFDNVDLSSKPDRRLTLGEKEIYSSRISDDPPPDKLEACQSLVMIQNHHLESSVLNQDNKLRSSALGLLEMEASAAYLRKLDVTDIQNMRSRIPLGPDAVNQKHLPILKAFVKEDSSDDRSIRSRKYLGYRFFLRKPAEVLVIGDEAFFTEEGSRRLLSIGFTLLSPERLRSGLKKGATFNHQFIAYDSAAEIDDVITEFSSNLPLRRVGAIELLALIESMFAAPACGERELSERLIHLVWSTYFEQIRGGYTSVTLLSSPQHEIYKPGSYNIHLSDHNATYPLTKDEYDKDQKRPAEQRTITYLEPLSSAAQTRLPAFRYRDFADYVAWVEDDHTLSGDIARFQLHEAASGRVLVLDERIQRFARDDYKSNGMKEPNAEIFKLSNVIVPDYPRLKLDVINLDDNVCEEILGFVEESKPSCYRPGRDFLLIHYSILERMYANEEILIRNTLCAWSKYFDVIVTSGRGKPKVLPKEVRFLHLSPVLNVFTENRCKYSMINLLNSARR